MSRKVLKRSQDSLGSISLIIKKRETGIKQDINSSNLLKEEKLLETHILKDSSETELKTESHKTAKSKETPFTQRIKELTHDEKNESKIGETVLIRETKPISKKKCWKLVKIVNKIKENE